MRKIIAIIVVLSTLFLSSCSFFDDKGYVVNYDINKQPSVYDPQVAEKDEDLLVILNVFEGLFSLSAEGEIDNAYAEGYSVSQDKTVYTFKLRDDGKWENGEKVTAYDFAFALKRVVLPETNSPAADRFYMIKNAQAVHTGGLEAVSLGVRAIDESTLVIELEEPNDELLLLLTTSYAFPCNEEFMKSTKGKYGLAVENVLANGPFSIYSAKEGKRVTLAKNKSYYNSQAVLPEGVQLSIQSEGNAASRLNSGETDAAIVSGEVYAEMRGKGYNSQPIENKIIGIAMNTNKEPLASEYLRQAIAMCFDTKKYSDHIPDHWSVANAIVPHGIMLGASSFREAAGDSLRIEYDPAAGYEKYRQGKAASEQTGIETLDLIINKDEYPELAELFSYPSQELQTQLSVYVNLRELDSAEYNAAIKSGNYDMAFVGIKSADYSIGSILSEFTKLNCYDSLQYELLLRETAAAAEYDSRLHGYKTAEEILISSAVFIPFAYVTDYFVEGDGVVGIEYNLMTGSISFAEAKK